MYNEILALNKLQWLICHKIQSNQTNVHEEHLFWKKLIPSLKQVVLRGKTPDKNAKTFKQKSEESLIGDIEMFTIYTFTCPLQHVKTYNIITFSTGVVSLFL